VSAEHPYSLALRVTVARTLAIAGVVLALAWGWVQHVLSLTVPWWLDTPAVFGFYGLLYYGLDSWAWRVPRIAAVLRVPDLRGTWRGTIRSSRNSFEDEHAVIVVITQSWSTIRIVLEGPWSISHSVAAHVTDGLGTESFEIAYQYANMPRAGAPTAMHAHVGTAHLRLSSDAQLLEGDYYSGRDRQHFGHIAIRREKT